MAAGKIKESEVAVIGSGFGGLSTALSLAERGIAPTVFEALNYPGGCASTFERQGHRFDSGATLFSGFHQGGLFQRWIERYGWELELEMSPPVYLRLGEHQEHHITLGGPLFDALSPLVETGKHPSLRRLLAHQKRTADRLWNLIDRPEMLPPLSYKQGFKAASFGLGLLGVLPLLGRPFQDLIDRAGLADSMALQRAIDAMLQITVQVPAREAEALFAISTLDYTTRGTAHVIGGIGKLAWAMAREIGAQGGRVHFNTRVKSVERDRQSGKWLIHTARGTHRCRALAINTLPRDAGRMLGIRTSVLAAKQSEVESGWGACMLYRVLDDHEDLPRRAAHFQLYHPDANIPAEGHHVFCSLSSPLDTPGQGTRHMTVSTHVARPDAMSADRADRVYARMRETIRVLAPELDRNLVHEMTGSPRTFARFTRRSQGWVGGIPRRVGIHNYIGQFLGPLAPGAYLVGDSIFPGQSTLATAVGGIRTARLITRSLPT